ncbi:hypothetical protein VKT23_003711 [Stygiomarasmius scandens]|uniref:Uncharacterized protein n=1 Tax=Marasmiellus scandens TaxID=2682957 RepID=A0ABR1K0B9_9AGAR
MDLSNPLNRLANNTKRGRYIDPDSLETLGIDEESQEHELVTFWTNNFGKGSVSSMQQVKEVQDEKGEKLCAHFLPLKDRNTIPTAIYNEEAWGMLLRGDYYTCYTHISSLVMHPRGLGPGVDVHQEKNKEAQSVVDEYMDEDMNGFTLSVPPPEESMESEEQTVKPILPNMEPTTSGTTYRALEEQSITQTPAVGEPIPPNMEPTTTCRSFKEAQAMLNVDEIQFPAQGPTGALFIISGHPGIGKSMCLILLLLLLLHQKRTVIFQNRRDRAFLFFEHGVYVLEEPDKFDHNPFWRYFEGDFRGTYALIDLSGDLKEPPNFIRNRGHPFFTVVAASPRDHALDWTEKLMVKQFFFTRPFSKRELIVGAHLNYDVGRERPLQFTEVVSWFERFGPSARQCFALAGRPDTHSNALMVKVSALDLAQVVKCLSSAGTFSFPPTVSSDIILMSPHPTNRGIAVMSPITAHILKLLKNQHRSQFRAEVDTWYRILYLPKARATLSHVFKSDVISLLDSLTAVDSQQTVKMTPMTMKSRSSQDNHVNFYYTADMLSSNTPQLIISLRNSTTTSYKKLSDVRRSLPEAGKNEIFLPHYPNEAMPDALVVLSSDAFPGPQQSTHIVLFMQCALGAKHVMEIKPLKDLLDWGYPLKYVGVVPFLPGSRKATEFLLHSKQLDGRLGMWTWMVDPKDIS